MITKKCPKCLEGKMIIIDEFQSWGKEELYFCTTCFHHKWLSSNDKQYEILGDFEKPLLNTKIQKEIYKVLNSEKKSEKKVMRNSILVLLGLAFFIFLFILLG